MFNPEIHKTKTEIPYFPRTEIKNGRDIEEEKERVRRKMLEKCENDPEAEMALAQIDFTELGNIITNKIYALCPELDGQKVNILEPDRIKFRKVLGVAYSPGEMACYETVADIMVVDFFQIKKHFPNCTSKMLAYLCTHEEVHAISKNVCEYGTYNNEVRQSGYRQSQYSGPDFYRYFDEAVNEKMAREIWVAYLEAKNVNQEGMSLAYIEYVNFLEEMIKEMASRTGEDENSLWQRIQKEKIVGVQNGETGLMDELEKVFSKEFVEALRSNKLKQALELLKK